MFETSFAAKCLVLILFNWQTGFSVSTPQEATNSKVYYRDQELGHKIRCTAITGEKGTCLSHSECFETNGRHSQLLCAAPVAQLICCIPKNITDQQFNTFKNPGQEDVSIGLVPNMGIIAESLDKKIYDDQRRGATTYRPQTTVYYTEPRTSTKRPQEFAYQFEKGTSISRYDYTTSTSRPNFQNGFQAIYKPPLLQGDTNRKIAPVPHLQKPTGLVTNNFGGAPRPITTSQNSSPSRPSSSPSSQNSGTSANDAIPDSTCKRVNTENINAFNKNFWDVLDYPHIVAVGINRVIRGQPQQIWKCVGSIIHEYYILTSASCARNEDSRKPEQEVNVILITDRSLNITYDEENLKRISKVSYNREVALIKVQKKIDFHRYTRPACFLDGALDKSVELFRSTWLRQPNEGQLMPSKDTMKIESQQICERFYGKTLTPDTFCAQLMQPNETSCDILSSPLFLANMELVTAYGDPIALYYLVAVESMVKPSQCGWPILYVNVNSYKSWIEREILK